MTSWGANLVGPAEDRSKTVASAVAKPTRAIADSASATPRQVRFNLHAIVPAGSLDVEATDPKPLEVKEDGKVTWELRPII